jgi:chromosome partitioning protein
METVEKLKHEINPDLELLGIALTIYDKRTRIAREVEAMAEERFGGKLFATRIPLCVRAAESPSHHKPVTIYAPASSVAQSYRILTQELLQCLKGCEIIL